MNHFKNRAVRVLLDANIIIDVMLERAPFFAASNQIMELCHSKKLEGYIALHSIPNIWYVLRKAGSDEMIRSLLSALLDYFDIPKIEKIHVQAALSRIGFPDFEDCLQDESAFAVHADCIITRNKRDFAHSKVPAYLPEEFIEMMG